MVNYDILERFGTNDSRLRKFFTSKMPDPRKQKKMSPGELKAITEEVKLREKFKLMVAGWLQEHIYHSLVNHAIYSAVDLAWDSCPINKQILPLMQYAQGRIDIPKAAKAMEGVPGGDKYVKKNKDGEPVFIDLPKFTEVNVNIVRSIIMRRVAAQSAKYAGLWPWWKYDPRNVSQVGYLRADLTSQRMDVMADDFGYRHQQDQFVREMLLYGHTVAFPRSNWERYWTYEAEKIAPELAGKSDFKITPRVSKEGIAWVTPHPSRLFYDNNHPLTSLNTDTGCEYVGYWDVCRWGDVMESPDFFNRDSVCFSRGMISWFTTFPTYFNQYFDRLIPPLIPNVDDDPAAKNDRKNTIGVYAGIYQGGMEEVATFYTNLWVKVIPQNWNWGTYPYPVWIHLKVAGDNTVVYAKIMPSSPGAVYSFNEQDARFLNISLAHEMLPFQDQITNLFSQLLEVVKRDLFTVATLNKDVFPDTEDGKKAYDEFVKSMTSKDYYAGIIILEASFSKMREMGIEIKGENIFSVTRAQTNTQIGEILQAITTTINLAERLAMMSAHEQGQVPSHEISATETAAISGTTDVIYNFISSPIDEGRAAMKRICFESLIACGTPDIELTVEARYPQSIVEQAGFEVKPNEDGDMPMGYVPGFYTIMGNKQNLIHNYIFNTRDGSFRSIGTQRAQVLVQILHAIGTLQPEVQKAVLTAMGKKKVLELINTMVRDSDAGVDLNMQLKDGESDSFEMGDDQQVMQAIQQLADTEHTTAKQVQAILQVISQTNPQAAAQIEKQSSPQGPPPGSPPGGMTQGAPPPQ